MMKQSLIALVLVSGMAQPATAQLAESPYDRNAKVPPPGAVDRSLQEDIAVFRVLLNRSLTRYYGLASLPANPHGFTHQMPQVEGVYLTGHGVVFSVSVPPVSDAMGKVEAPAKALTDWEKVLLEVRGEKQPEEKKTERPKRLPLTDVMLDLMVENGKQFKKLAAAERLTIALTFRSSLDCSKCHSDVTNLGISTGQRSSEWRVSSEGKLYPLVGHAMLQPNRSLSLTAPANQKPQELSSEQLTGDLMFKQGKYAEAEQSYQRALQRLQSVKDMDEKQAAKFRRALQITEIAGKLAQCAAAQGQVDKAKQMLELMRRINEMASKLTDDEKSTASTLPTQLVISATKQQLLDQAGAGKVGSEAFRKIASVELRTPEAKPEK